MDRLGGAVCVALCAQDLRADSGSLRSIPAGVWPIFRGDLARAPDGHAGRSPDACGHVAVRPERCALRAAGGGGLRALDRDPIHLAVSHALFPARGRLHAEEAAAVSPLRGRSCRIHGSLPDLAQIEVPVLLLSIRPGQADRTRMDGAGSSGILLRGSAGNFSAQPVGVAGTGTCITRLALDHNGPKASFGGVR